MSTFMKILLVPALVVAFSVGVALAASGVGGSDDSSSPLAQVAPSTVDSTTLETTTGATTTVEDLDDREPGEDVSGPCDEAENANDPRCTGAGDDRDDDSGPGNGQDDDRDGDDRDDNSGPGNGHDDDDDDNSGPGNDDDDDHGDDDGDDHGDDDDDDHGDDDRGGHGEGEDDR